MSLAAAALAVLCLGTFHAWGKTALSGKEMEAIYIETRPRYNNDMTAELAPGRWMDILLFPPDFSAIAAYGSRTFVRIGMEILEAQIVFLGLDEIRGPITADYIVSDYPSPTLGYGYAGNMISVVPAGSRRDITTVTGVGALLDIDVTVEKLTADAVSWGDPDGFGDIYTKAGYVGVADLAVGNVRMDGVVTINVVREPPAGGKLLYVGLAPGAVVSMGSFMADVKLDSAKTLGSPYAQTLGIFGLSGLEVRLGQGIDIKVYSR